VCIVITVLQTAAAAAQVRAIN